MRTAAHADGACCAVLELRQYTTHPGQRDVLIELFDREFVESQEAHGMHIVGQFRDLGRADRFVWLRGFADMTTRGAALRAFYGGPVWARHGSAANATMVAFDDVLLLRPALPHTALAHDGRPRPTPPGDAPAPGSLVEVTICPLDQPAGAELLQHLDRTVLPALSAAGGPSPACFVTEHAENTFPALPVRTGEQVLVWITRPARASPTERPSERRAASRHQPPALTSALEGFLAGPPQTLHLSPTARSQLR